MSPVSSVILTSVKITFGIPFDSLLFEILTFVMEFLALGQGDFDFDLAARKIGFGRNQGQAFHRDFADQAFDFIFVEQEFTRPHWFVVVNVAV